MGCGKSTLKPKSAIDAKLVQAIREKKLEMGDHKHSFNELLLKFPKLAAGFTKCRDMFKVLDVNGDNYIDLQEFTNSCEKVGFSQDSPLKDIFKAADLDGSSKVDVYEFVLIFTIVHLLHPEQSSKLDPDITRALDIVQDAFCYFDATTDGYLARAEMQKALEGPNTPGKQTVQVADKLFDYLDFDGSGRISFKEFLVGVEKMVMEEYNDEE